MPKSSRVLETPRQRKARAIERLRELAERYPVIMFADFGGMPSSHFQRLRKLLAGRARIVVAKKRIAKVALSDLNRPGMDKLLEAIPQQLAVIFTEEPPGKLYREISGFYAEVPIKPGQEAQDDVVIPAGPTDLPPGPAMTDLRALDIPTKIQGGKIAITRDVPILKRGERASQQVADVLKLLGIKPIRVVLRVTGALDRDGLFYSPDVLEIGPEIVSEWVARAASAAVNLAVEIGLVTPQTARPLLIRATAAARRLAVEIGLVTPETLPEILALARARAAALARAAGAG